MLRAYLEELWLGERYELAVFCTYFEVYNFQRKKELIAID